MERRLGGSTANTSIRLERSSLARRPAEA